MNIRRFRALHERGASYVEIAAECGVDWRTVRKYLAPDAPSAPPQASSRKGTQPRVIDGYVGVIDAWLRRDASLRASVVFERLVAEHGFAHTYQRVKMYVVEARPRIEAELAGRDENRLAGLHRRFETLPGAQAQFDWGEEKSLSHKGIKVYSFHMVLSYSRDPFCCYVTSTDLGSFFDCHRRAFAHFGGVPGSIVYDRTKTVVKRHVAPGAAVPLHPEAAAFAEHYGFAIDVLAAYRPTGKGRVERQVNIVREHVLAGREFDTIAEMDAAFTAWVPIRRLQVHRTHSEIIGDRAEVDRAALLPLPEIPYLVADRQLRRVGKDCLISFETSLYSVPATRVRAGQPVEVRATADLVAIHAIPGQGAGQGSSQGAGDLLAVHRRSTQRGRWVVDQAHWNGLPDGHTRAVCLDPAEPGTQAASTGMPGSAAGPASITGAGEPNPLTALLRDHPAAATQVSVRDLGLYERAAGLDPASQ